jgi:hypothetical protein
MSSTLNAPMMPSASKHGVFLGLALILVQTIFYLADIRFDSGLGYLSYLVLIGGLFLSIKAYRDQFNDGFVSYGRAVGYGVLVALLAGVISSVFTFVLYEFIDPNLIDKLLLESENKMIDSGRRPTRYGHGDEQKSYHSWLSYYYGNFRTNVYGLSFQSCFSSFPKERRKHL